MGIILFLIFLAIVAFLSMLVVGIIWWYHETKQVDEIGILPDPKERDKLDSEEDR